MTRWWHRWWTPIAAEIADENEQLLREVVMLTRERDHYLAALELLGKQNYIRDVHAVLKEGKKIRGES